MRERLAAAVPSLLAAAACGIAWFDPVLLGFDLLRLAAPLLFLELPLAVLYVFADTWRVPDEQLPRAQKWTWLLIPSLGIGALCTVLFGLDGLLAVVLLGGAMAWRLWREGEDRRDTGRWLVVDGKQRHVLRTRPARGRYPGAWVLPLSDHEFLPALSIFTWAGLAIVLFTGAPVPFGGATPEYAGQVGWTATPVGGALPAHLALAAGLALFLLRALAISDESGVDGEIASGDDAVVREIIDRVEQRSRRS